MITVRQITADDLPEIQGWAKARGCILEPKLISPHGFVAVNDKGRMVITAWAVILMDVPIVLVDHVYMPRRFKADEARQGWHQLIETIRDFVRKFNKAEECGYSLIEIVMNPVMEREATAQGGQVSASLYKKCHYLV